MTSEARVGDVLAGKYRVNRVLGVGGMGMVVEATHLELEQRVALKFMLADAMHSQNAVDRFLREAKAAVMLRNEHVCRVLDVGKLESGAPYIVMEFMDGHDFAALLRQRGQLPIAEAVDYVLQALEGVAEAHAKRIVHRDLKPANLFVTSDSDGSPLVKVLDFGISKTGAAVGSATKTGDILGSPAYMAPEQMMSSKNVDARADVWAFGVILYEAITGQLPFVGESLSVLCMSVIHDEPAPPTQHRPDLDPAFASVILHCLDKRLDHRFPDVASLASALAPFGGPEAALAAGRIVRMRARAMSPAVQYADTVAPGAVTPIPANAITPAPARAPAIATPAPGAVTPAPITPNPAAAPPLAATIATVSHPAQPGVISTLQSGAGSLELARAQGPQRKWTLVAVGTSVMAVGLVVFAVIAFRSRDGERRTESAPVPATTPPPEASAPPASAPTPAPTERPLVTEPPPAPAAATPPPATAPSTDKAPAEPAAPKPAQTGSSPTPKRKPKPPATPPATTPPPPRPTTNPCDPPYVIDGTGKRIYKPECL